MGGRVGIGIQVRLVLSVQAKVRLGLWVIGS